MSGYDNRGGLLGATRIDSIVIEDYPVTEEFSEGVGSMIVKTHVHESASGKEVIVKKETIILNQSHLEIRSETDWWDYQSVHSPPMEHLKEIEARLWLPGRGRRGSLALVESQETVFWWESIYAQQSGELSYRTKRSGEVIYRMAPDLRTLTADQIEKLEDQGRNVAGSPQLQIILDSAMPWDQAVSQSAIVEAEDQPATTIWRDLELIEHRVEETWAIIMSYTLRKDLIHPGAASVDGPHYQKKAGVVFQLPVPLDPPEITKAAEISDSIRIVVEGGGAVLTPSWPEGTTIPIRPEKYRIYRRVVSMPSRSLNDDPTGIWETPPTAAERLGPPVGETGTTTTAGGPASSLPAAAPDAEPEDPSPPDAERWEMIAEVDNEVKDKRATGRGTTTDTDVQSGADYEYRATSVVSEQESEPSRHAAVSYGGATSSGSMRVTVGRDDDLVSIDVVAPVDVEVEGILGVDGEEYGETIVFNNIPIELGFGDGLIFTGSGLDDLTTSCIMPGPIGVEIDGTGTPDTFKWTRDGGSTWGDAGIEITGDKQAIDGEWCAEFAATTGHTLGDRWDTDEYTADDLGEEVGQAQMIRNQGLRRFQVTSAAPLLNIQRGQLITVPAVGWSALGGGLIMSSETTALTLRVDGFGFRATATADGFEMSSDALDCLEVGT